MAILCLLLRESPSQSPANWLLDLMTEHLDPTKRCCPQLDTTVLDLFDHPPSADLFNPRVPGRIAVACLAIFPTIPRVFRGHFPGKSLGLSNYTPRTVKQIRRFPTLTFSKPRPHPQTLSRTPRPMIVGQPIPP
ncbi:MAG: hypothetical protein R3C99_25815 [Pirellulaceae bacterium]